MFQTQSKTRCSDEGRFRDWGRETQPYPSNYILQAWCGPAHVVRRTRKDRLSRPIVGKSCESVPMTGTASTSLRLSKQALNLHTDSDIKIAYAVQAAQQN